MTDKQTIIHGVDVSGCTKYEHEIIRCNTSLKNMCFYGGRCTDKRNADCYYKQLKCKEQECEKLKEIANNALDKVNNYLDKKEKSLLYKQTLAEIKEISENFIKNVSNRCIETTRMYGVHTQILQKISEVEE